MIPDVRVFNGKPFLEAEGKVLYRYKTIAQTGDHAWRIRFLSVDSPYKQGVAFNLSRTFKGKLFLNGKRLAKPKKASESLMVFEEGSFPDNSFEFRLSVEEGSVSISCASDMLGDYCDLDRLSALLKKDASPTRSYVSGFTAGAYGNKCNAFWIEPLSESRYRYHCNDHAADDDFDDMVFELEIL